MKLLTSEKEWTEGNTVVAFGTFDGVHAGHQELIRLTIEQAEARGVKSVVYTYSNHPIQAFCPEKTPLQLQTRHEKVKSLAETGVYAAILRPFDVPYARQAPEQFIRAVCAALHPCAVVIGFNYSFGAKGLGKPKDMRQFGEILGFETYVVDELRLCGDVVSSTRIRHVLTEEGNVELARVLLKKPYAFCGEIADEVPGAGQLSLIAPAGKVLPKAGEYSVLAEDGEEKKAGKLSVIPYADRNNLLFSISTPFRENEPGKKIRISFLKRLD